MESISWMRKKGGYHTLYQSDDSILLKLHSSGYFNPSAEILDSKNTILAKTSKKGLMTETVRLENSKGEKILECKVGLDCHILDKNENTVAELITKRFKNDWTLNFQDSHFDRKMILGFSFV